MNEAEIFRPGIAELRRLAERFTGLTINGLDDEAGYLAVKEGQKELAEMRITITKFGKKAREEALAYQREVLRQEKEHLEIIVPLEDKLKSKLIAIDEAKKIEERRILLPARIKLLNEIGISMSEDDILKMDEDSFSAFHSNQKLLKLEAEDRKRKEIEDAERRKKELEQAKKDAAAKAVADERERAKRKEEKRKEAEAEQKRIEEAQRVEMESKKKYLAWLDKHGVKAGDTFHIKREGNTFTLYKKIDTITI